MFRRKTTEQPQRTITASVVPDTDAAVAAKMRGLAAKTSNPDRARSWTQTAEAAEAGQLHPSIRGEFARGVTFTE